LIAIPYKSFFLEGDKVSKCPSFENCPFYNDKMDNKPALANMYKKNYCEGNYDGCARWKVANTLGKQAVPLDLFPNQIDRIDSIINRL
jgi:hypothetical protein